MTDAPPTDDREPARVVAEMIDHVLRLAATWTAWDGLPVPSEDRIYTPHGRSAGWPTISWTIWRRSRTGWPAACPCPTTGMRR